MSGRNVRLQHGPTTHEVSADVAGGQLVMPDTANPGKVIPTDGAVASVLGVALHDAHPEGTAEQQSPLNTAWARPNVSVACNGEVKVTYAGQTDFGAPLVAAADGQVAAAGATPTIGTIVGRCTEPAGVTGAGVVARAWIRA